MFVQAVWSPHPFQASPHSQSCFGLAHLKFKVLCLDSVQLSLMCLNSRPPLHCHPACLQAPQLLSPVHSMPFGPSMVPSLLIFPQCLPWLRVVGVGDGVWLLLSFSLPSFLFPFKGGSVMMTKGWEICFFILVSLGGEGVQAGILCLVSLPLSPLTPFSFSVFSEWVHLWQ